MRDVRGIGHFGTGDLEITIQIMADFEMAEPFFGRPNFAQNAQNLEANW